MFEVWNWHIKYIVQLSGDTQELDHAFCLLAEMSVQLERFVGIHLGYFKIAFWPSDQYENATPMGLLTKHVDNALVARLEQDKQILD